MPHRCALSLSASSARNLAALVGLPERLVRGDEVAAVSSQLAAGSVCVLRIS